MEVDYHLQRQLELYLADAFPTADRAAFEQQMAENPDLMEEIRLQQGIDCLLESGRRIELEQELEQIAQQHPYTPSLWQQPFRWGLIAAITLLVLCVVFLMRPKSDPEETLAQIVEEQWQAYPNLLPSSFSGNNSAREWRGGNLHR